MTVAPLSREGTIRSIAASEKYSVAGGPFGSELTRRDYVGSGVPVVRGVNLPTDKRFSFDEFVYVSPTKAASLRGNQAGPGDIIVTQRGTLGQVGLIPPSSPYPLFVISQSQMKLTVDPAKAVPLFVYYYLRAPRTVAAIRNMAITAGVPHINLGLFQNMPIHLPPLPAQRRIASILSAYDDLIENNTRRIQILEEMAQAIYREWFVEFRFPGHEHVRMVDSELGLIPEGWRERPLAEVASVTMGQSPPSGFYNETSDGLPFFQGVTNFGKHFPTPKTFSTSGDRRAKAGDILFSVRAPVGRINISDRELILGRGLCAIRPEAEAGMFVLFQLKHAFQTEDAIGSGSIFNAVKRSEVESLPLIWPTAGLVTAFGELSDPMFSLVEKLTHANSILRRTRDLLLPRLISGEIDVSEFDTGEPDPVT